MLKDAVNTLRSVMSGGTAGVLSAAHVAELLEQADTDEDPLVITPMPNLRELRASGAASVDLRLGCWFLASRPRNLEVLDLQPPEESIDPARRPPRVTKTLYVPFGRHFIIHPRTFILAGTMEWIRLPTNLAGYVIGRSSVGRAGLIIATATGVHPTFAGCLTLELANVGEIPLKLKPGTSICQLFLHTLTRAVTGPEQSQFVGYRHPVFPSLSEDITLRELAREPVLSAPQVRKTPEP